MTLYRKVFTKDRLPESEGMYIVGYEYGSFSCYYNKQYSFHDESTDCTIIEWWLEEVKLGDLKFSKEDATPDFVHGINYILNKLKG